MESQISSELVLLAIVFVFVAAAFVARPQTGNRRQPYGARRNRYNSRRNNYNDGEQDTYQGQSFIKTLTLAVFIAVGIGVLANGGIPSAAESPTLKATDSAAQNAASDNAPLQSASPDPEQLQYQTIGKELLTNFFLWRNKALASRDWSGYDQFLTGKAGGQMVVSVARLQTENCAWKENAPALMIVMAHNLKSDSFTLSANFDEAGTLYCKGTMDSRSFVPPTRIGTMFDIVRVNNRWLIQDASALNPLVGMIQERAE